MAISGTTYGAGSDVYIAEVADIQKRQKEKSEEEFRSSEQERFNSGFIPKTTDPEEANIAFNRWYEPERKKREARLKGERDRAAQARLEVLIADGGKDPEKLRELNMFKNYIESPHADMDAGTWFAALRSPDPMVRQMVISSQNKIHRDLRSAGAHAMDIETTNAQATAWSFNPTANGGRGQVEKGAVYTYGYKGQTGADVDYREELQKSLDPKKMALQFAKDNLSDELSPESYSGVAIEEDVKTRMRMKSVATEVRKAVSQYSNTQGLSKVARDRLIVGDAMMAAGVFADGDGEGGGTVSPAEYLHIAQAAFTQLTTIRDDRANALQATATIQNKQRAKDSYDGVLATIDSMMTQMSNSPEVGAQMLEGSFGTSDAITAVALIEGEGKMDVLDALKGAEFSTVWSKSDPKDRYRLFVDAVLDHTMSLTGDLRHDDQIHYMNTISKMREANASGTIGNERLLNHQLTTMYNMFTNTQGSIYDENAMAERARNANNQYTAKVGGKDYIVSGGYSSDSIENEKLGNNAQAISSMLGASPAMMEIAKGAGLVTSDSVINSQQMGWREVAEIYRGMLGDPRQDDELKLFWEGDDAGFDAMLDGASTLSQQGFDVARASNGELTTDEYILKQLGGTELASLIMSQVKTNPVLKHTLYSLDGEVGRGAVIAALKSHMSTIRDQGTRSMLSGFSATQAATSKYAKRNLGMDPDGSYLDNNEKAFQFWADKLRLTDDITSLDSDREQIKDQINILDNMIRQNNELLKPTREAIGSAGEQAELMHQEMVSLRNALTDVSTEYTKKIGDETAEGAYETMDGTWVISDRMLYRQSGIQNPYSLPTSKSFKATPEQGGATSAVIDIILSRNKELDFVKRIREPNGAPSIGDSTHLMATASIDIDGEEVHIVYPTMVRKEGESELERLDAEEAIDYAVESGEYIKFGNARSALVFSQDYKKVWE